MELPVYKGVIDDNEDTGVNAVAFVDDPAISRNFQAFNEHKKFEFSITDKEQRIVSGPLMVADMPIYRRDERGEYYMFFDADTIKAIALRFFKNQQTRNVNLMHQGAYVDSVFMFESLLVDSKRGNTAPAHCAGISEGSWIGSFKVNNDEVWEKVKNGELNGFSVEGIFGQVHVENNDSENLAEIHDALSETLNVFAQIEQHPFYQKSTQNK